MFSKLTSAIGKMLLWMTTEGTKSYICDMQLTFERIYVLWTSAELVASWSIKSHFAKILDILHTISDYHHLLRIEVI
jgi:hypothetical protein